MLVSQFVSGVSAEFSLVRSGNQLTATFHYDLTGFEDEEGIFHWDGEIGAAIGTHSDYFQQTSDRPMDLQFVATLASGVNTATSYFVNDNIGGAAFDHEFNVVIFDTATNFVGTSAADLVFGSGAADTFRSVGGGDMFEGGAGDDLYRAGSARRFGDPGACETLAISKHFFATMLRLLSAGTRRAQQSFGRRSPIKDYDEAPQLDRRSQHRVAFIDREMNRNTGPVSPWQVS